MTDQTLKNRIDEMIIRYTLYVNDKNGVSTAIAGRELAENKADHEFISNNVENIKNRIPEREAEIAEKYRADKAAIVKFYIFGWESHEVTVDTREDLDKQFARIAERHPHDCTAESIKRDYENHIAETAKKAAAKKLADEENQIKEKEKAARKALYTEIKVYTHINPKGGEEDGIDGFHDAEYRNIASDEVIRMVTRDVFDFGVYSFPKHVGDTKAVFDRESWSASEIKLADWLHEFGPFYGLRM